MESSGVLWMGGEGRGVLIGILRFGLEHLERLVTLVEGWGSSDLAPPAIDPTYPACGQRVGMGRVPAGAGRVAVRLRTTSLSLPFYQKPDWLG